MNDMLPDAVRRHAETCPRDERALRTPIPGLVIIRACEPSGLEVAISRPLVCLLLQGRKWLTTGGHTFDFSARDSLLITADVPTTSQILEASDQRPYFSLLLDLDLHVI